MNTVSSQGIKLDDFDRKILEIIQLSNRTTSDQIAEQVGLSPSAVQRRINRMREQRIILSELSVVNPKMVGRNVILLVQVTLERERVDLLDNFRKAMKAHPAVQQCYYVTGSVDFILVVTALNMEGYEAFTREVFFANQNIRNFSTHVVMDSVKTGLFVPVF
ncbi:ArsR family transcriptional regulator [Candidatus Endobugula sertula]|uniref:ArsR family transcriptional regulator n=1 Tax=Candidatus Endobugula sertula TaxID=62101 RepID=A0A1D2QU06_9GAMM|nr:ArsR family transcriptional regulator [Candidatus Endobugula sertula]